MIRLFVTLLLVALSLPAQAGFLGGFVAGSVLNSDSGDPSRPDSVVVQPQTPGHSVLSCKKSKYFLNRCDTYVQHRWTPDIGFFDDCDHRYGNDPAISYSRISFGGDCAATVYAMSPEEYVKAVGFEHMWSQAVVLHDGNQYLVLEVSK